MLESAPKIAIVGAGPAGASLAIRLASNGFNVTVIEKETFPRHKLCGEFISPECLRHFESLGVLDKMLNAGGERIVETRFYDRRGNGFSVPSSLLDDGGFALSLSRSEMDRILLDKASEAGAKVLDGTKLTDVDLHDSRILSINVIGKDRQQRSLEADLFVDATGRNLALSKLGARKLSGVSKTARRSIAVGFKNHFSGVSIPQGICEIFVFPGGYGGLTSVENGLVNLCFLIDSKAARRIGTNADTLVEQAVFLNARAAAALANAKPVGDWLAVSINAFGRNEPPNAVNLFSIGDAAAFIDPFTGSGMLMALESSALLASAIAAYPFSPARIAAEYHAEHHKLFGRRLRVCSILRRAAFLPVIPSAVIGFLRLSKLSRNYLAGSTRSAKHWAPNTPETFENQ